MALPPRRVLEAVTGHLVREAEIGGMAAIAKAADRPADFCDAVAALIGASRDENFSTTAHGDELDGRAQPLPAFKRATGRLKCDGSRLRVRLPKTNTFEASKLNSSRHPGRGRAARRGGRGAKDRLSAECRARIIRPGG